MAGSVSNLWIGRDGDGRLHIFGRKPSLHTTEERWVIACLHCALQEEGYCARYSLCGDPLPMDMYPELQPCECKELKTV